MNNTDKAVELFKRTDMLHRKTFESLAKNLDIHRTQHMVLMFLSRFSDGVSQKQIAEKFKISSAAVAVTVKKLEKKELVKKTADKTDGRYNLIFLTEKGNEMVKITHKVFSDIDRNMFEGLSEGELSTFIACHEKMQQNLINYREKNL